MGVLEQEGSTTQRGISERLKIPKQSVNNVAIALKNDGYISLLPGKDDKREKIMVLTEQGRVYSQSILAALTEKLSGRLKAVQPEWSAASWALGWLGSFLPSILEHMPPFYHKLWK